MRLRLCALIGTLGFMAITATAGTPWQKPANKALNQAQDKPLSAKEVFAKYKTSMVQIEAPLKTPDADGDQLISRGTGFFFRSPDVIVTAYHVIDDAKSLVIKDSQNQRYTPTAIVYDEKADIALIAVSDKSSSPPFPVGLFKSVQTGETVYVIGNPLGKLMNSITQGIVSAKRQSKGISLIQFSAAISEGNSGGPVINDHGLVIGVVSFAFTEGESLNMASAIDPAFDFLSSRDSWPSAESFFKATKSGAGGKTGTGKSEILYSKEADVTVEEIAKSKEGKAEFEHIAISRDGKFVVGAYNNRLHLIDTTQKSEIRAESFDSDISGVAFGKDDMLAVSFTDGVIELRTVKDWRLEKKISVGKEVLGPRFTASGNFLYFSEKSESEGELSWNLRTYSLVEERTLVFKRDYAYGGRFVFAPGGEYIAGWSLLVDEEDSYNVVEIVSPAAASVRTLKPVSLDAKKDDLTLYLPIGFSADGKQIFCLRARIAEDDSFAAIESFDVESGLSKRKFTLKSADVSDVQITKDGKFMFIGILGAVGRFNLREGDFDFLITEAPQGEVATSDDASVFAFTSGNVIRVMRILKKSSINSLR